MAGWVWVVRFRVSPGPRAIRPDRSSPSLPATTAATPGFPERISVSGTNGTALLTSSHLRTFYEDGRVEIFGDADPVPGTGAASAQPMAFSHEGHLAVLTDFIEAIEQDRPPMVDGMGVIKAHRLIDAILASAYSEKVIHVMA